MAMTEPKSQSKSADKKSKRKSKREGKGIRRVRGGQPTPRKPSIAYPTTITDANGKLIIVTKYTRPRVGMSFRLPLSLMGGYRPQGNYGSGSGVIVVSKVGKSAA